jgi:4,5-dihydroxyphthalate decarboxylase
LQTLIPQPHVAAQRWYERTAVIPTNHMFVIDQALSQTRPDVVREIYRMLVLSTKAAPEKTLASFPSLGIEANRKTLELAIAWSFEQKMIPRRMSVDELFDDTTGALS